LPPPGKWSPRLSCSGDRMPVNPDFRDLFSILNEEKVEYLVAGAHAVIYHTEPRYTKDLDIWVNPTPENAQRVYKALARFGAPLRDISAADFCDPDLVYQIGVAPNRIDILMGVSGVGFSSAWADRVASTYGGIPILIMGKSSLLAAKKAAGRPQDLLDVEKLQQSDS
jgi:hypothetical protein